MSKYWQVREAQQREKYLSKSEKEIAVGLRKMYEASANDIVRDMELLYLRILEEGDETLPNNLYRYNRYYHLREQVNRKLTKLGARQLKELTKEMEGMYKYTSSQVLSSLGFEVGNEKELQLVAKSMWDNRTSWSKAVWCADGLTAEGRVARNMAQLQKTLEKGLQDCVARGTSKDELVKTLMKRFDVSYANANRLARTELTYIQNQATRDSYIKAGVKQYEYFAELDDRTSEQCEDMNGQRFDVANAVVGVNYPPLHPFAVALFQRFWIKPIKQRVNNKYFTEVYIYGNLERY